MIVLRHRPLRLAGSVGRRLGLVVMLAVGFAASVPVRAQEGAAVPKTYFNKNVVHLPIQLDPASRSQVQELHLLVKDSVQAPWSPKDRAEPTQPHFTYRAPQDGEYWFTVVTVDKAGRTSPMDVNSEPPIIVVVDTTPPVVEVFPMGDTPEGTQVRCTIRDAHPDAGKTRFYYQTRDQIWRTAEPSKGHSDLFLIPAQAAITGKIKVVAVDLAANTTAKELHLADVPLAANAPAMKSGPDTLVVNTVAPEKVVFTPPGESTSGPVIVEKVSYSPQPAPTTFAPNTLAPTPAMKGPVTEKPAPFSERVEIVSTGKPFNPITTSGPALEPVAAKPPVVTTPPPQTTMAPTPVPELKTVPERFTPTVQPEPPQKPHLVNSTRIFMDYQVEQLGASGVGKVEIWYTRDLGQTWLKLGEDADRKSPAEIALPGEGVYGVTLVVANGRGFGGTPPTAGDTPDWWVEVDLTKPKADISGVRSGHYDDGSIEVGWTAKDKNIAAEPVDLYFATQRQGPWKLIAKGLKNDGVYRWTPTSEAGSHAFIRLVVHDQAGNSSASDTTQPVALDDLSRPRGRLTSITTAPRTAPTANMGTPSTGFPNGGLPNSGIPNAGISNVPPPINPFTPAPNPLQPVGN